MTVIPWFGRTFCARKKLNKEHFPVNFYDFGPTYLIFSSKNINKHITPFGVGEWKTIGSSLLAKPKEVYPLPSSPIRPYSSPRQEQAPQRFIHSPWQNFRISVASLKKSCMGTCNIHWGTGSVPKKWWGRLRVNLPSSLHWKFIPHWKNFSANSVHIFLPSMPILKQFHPPHSRSFIKNYFP